MVASGPVYCSLVFGFDLSFVKTLGLLAIFPTEDKLLQFITVPWNRCGNRLNRYILCHVHSRAQLLVQRGLFTF
jgi:hypothetical protein